MPRLLLPLIIVLVLAGGGFYFYQNLQKKAVYQSFPSPQAISTPSPSPQSSTPSSVTKSGPCEVLTKGSTDVPALYKEGIIWQEPVITEYEAPLGEEGSRKMEGCLIKSRKTQSDLSLKTVDYYGTNLAKLGWSILVSASGPNGSTDSYRKERGYFLVREILQANSTDMIVELFYAK